MKKITIEKLLTWAFTQELCKVGATGEEGGALSGGWQAFAGMAELGTLIDRTPNYYGVIPDFVTNGGDPHPDAVAVGDAVRALADHGGYDIDGTMNLFPEWTDERGLIALEVARMAEELQIKRDILQASHVVNLVISSAILARGPDWHAERPAEKMVERAGKPAWFIMRKAADAFGRPYTYETDGRDKRTHRPLRGAYRKFELSSPLRGAIVARMEWSIWQSALSELYAALSGRLAAHDLQPFTADYQPWLREHRRQNSLQASEIAG